MVYRRKLRQRRRRITKARRIPRKPRRTVAGGQMRLMRWSSQAAPNVHLNIAGQDLAPSGTGTTVFQLSQVNSFTEIVNLFDNFRITKIAYRWVILRNPDQVTTATYKGIYPRINWTHDFNDQQPISRDNIYQRANMREVWFSDNNQKSRWYTLKPSVLVTMYESSIANAYTPKWKQWLDTADNAAPHYGIKYAFDNLYLGMNLVMEAKIYLEAKGIS